MVKRLFNKERALSNMSLKALSVALALSLWFYVTYRGQSDIVIDSPVEFKNIPNGMELLRQNAKKVSLNIRGHERILHGLRPGDARVIVDLSAAKKGEATYNLDSGDVAIPRSLKVLRIEPNALKVILDESSAKTVPIKPYVVGIPEKGYRIQSVSVDPKLVEVEGAKTEVSRIRFLRTDQVDVTGLDEDVNASVRLNTNGRNIRTSVSEVNVIAEIRRAP